MKDKKKKIVGVIIAVLTAVILLLECYNHYKDTGEVDANKITEALTTVVDSLAEEDNIEVAEIDTDVSTTETIESSEIEEKEIETEEATENDAVVEQENISYDGSTTGNGLNLLGAYQGLTYYSQADSRWNNYLYTSTGNSTQTMKSSACGPTSASMVVSSSKGAILPTTMADLFVKQGFRTSNNGTAWSAYSWVADYFDFNGYAYVSNLDSAINYLRQGYFVICSCGSGLFTYSGHYIVLAGIDEDTIKIYDPYLYNGKFDVASRRGKVSVSGNTVYCSINNFRNYANAKGFWCYSNDSESAKITDKTNENISYIRYVSTQSANLIVRNSPNGTKVGSLVKGTLVTVYELKGNWSKIGDNRWVSSSYLSASYVSNSNKTVAKYTTGTYKVTSNINVRSGPSTKYSKKKYYNLTSNARNQNRKFGNYYYNGYKKGVVCTVTKINNNWGYTKSGWICLDYCKKY